MDLVLLADLWEENQECLKQHLGESTANRFGARWVLMPTVPSPRFNHVGCIRIPGDQVDDLVAAARAFYRAERMPLVAFLTTPATQPPDLSQRLLKQGFWTETVPVMVWDGRPVAASPRRDLHVERMLPGETALFWEVLRRVFFPGASEAALAAGRRGVEITSALGATNYIAFVGGKPAGAGTLFIRGAMAGIYNMCTLPQYQRMGVATAILRAAIADGLASGCRHVGLTPTEMGRQLYQRLGFRVVYEEVYLSQRIQ